MTMELVFNGVFDKSRILNVYCSQREQHHSGKYMLHENKSDEQVKTKKKTLQERESN